MWADGMAKVWTCDLVTSSFPATNTHSVNLSGCSARRLVGLGTGRVNSKGAGISSWLCGRVRAELVRASVSLLLKQPHRQVTTHLSLLICKPKTCPTEQDSTLQVPSWQVTLGPLSDHRLQDLQAGASPPLRKEVPQSQVGGMAVSPQNDERAEQCSERDCLQLGGLPTPTPSPTGHPKLLFSILFLAILENGDLATILRPGIHPQLPSSVAGCPHHSLHSVIRTELGFLPRPALIHCPLHPDPAEEQAWIPTLFLTTHSIATTGPIHLLVSQIPPHPLHSDFLSLIQPRGSQPGRSLQSLGMSVPLPHEDLTSWSGEWPWGGV